jgi:hypothetical protein
LKETAPENQSYEGGEKLIFFQIGTLGYVEETNETLEENDVSEIGAHSTLSPVEN